MFSVYGYNKMALIWEVESDKNMLLGLTRDSLKYFFP